MRISKQCDAYNERRYGRPWIGIVASWPVGGRPEIRWGGYAGNEDGGELEIEAEAGDIVRWGQKDRRGNRSTNEWGIVAADGAINECDPVEARAQWTRLQNAVAPEAPATPLAGLSAEVLLAEVRRRGLTVAEVTS